MSPQAVLDELTPKIGSESGHRPTRAALTYSRKRRATALLAIKPIDDMVLKLVLMDMRLAHRPPFDGDVCRVNTIGVTRDERMP